MISSDYSIKEKQQFVWMRSLHPALCTHGVVAVGEMLLSRPRFGYESQHCGTRLAQVEELAWSCGKRKSRYILLRSGVASRFSHGQYSVGARLKRRRYEGRVHGM
ncbi:hypothetical protein AVEN_142909-1 [Araneus ventricosus]|uniref:Uncharacterized protein n=1 Tax=Araneus ventricosus TaxID=182803 RepID=A0A4Y2FN67_ARAVE|nr:hypothetical protein AVEN_142909-1 [Araneus ventricosus]